MKNLRFVPTLLHLKIHLIIEKLENMFNEQHTVDWYHANGFLIQITFSNSITFKFTKHHTPFNPFLAPNHGCVTVMMLDLYAFEKGIP